MVSILAALVLHSAFDESGAMPPAGYRAKSDLLDEKALGGYGASDNASWSMKDVDVTGKGVFLVVKKNACCMTKGGSCPMILALANGNPDTVWFRAEDSRLAVGREAMDNKGVWRPIEFRAPSDCGNSYHRVALGGGRAWTWDVPSDNGPFATKCRYVLYGLDKSVFSGEFDAKINAGMFLLPEEWSKGYELKPDGSLSFRKG